jgi:type VI secretion system protein ImpH
MSVTVPELEEPTRAADDPAPVALTPFERQLATKPHEFEFYQVMRLLEALHRERPRFGRSARPSQDLLRLAQEPSVTHAPASLAGYEKGANGAADRLLVHFFGLFGTDGPLPLHLTEYARDRRRNHNDPTFARFVDLFHHRAMSLFYRAWADVRPTISFDRPEQDRFGEYVASLIGLATLGLRDRDAMPDLTKLHFAGHLGAQTKHAEGLASMLSAFFDMPVRVDGFIGAWLTLPASDYTRLSGGGATAGLGQSALVGGRVWSRQHKFRIVFGPLSLAEYERLLPGGLSFHRLIPIVRNYAGDVLIWDVNLILKRPEVPATRLGQRGRLGWTTWLMPRRAETDAADLFLDASADSHASTIDKNAEPEDLKP